MGTDFRYCHCLKFWTLACTVPNSRSADLKTFKRPIKSAAMAKVTGTLYTYPDNFRAYKALIAAKYSGASVKTDPKFVFGETNKSKQFLSKRRTKCWRCQRCPRRK